MPNWAALHGVTEAWRKEQEMRPAQFEEDFDMRFEEAALMTRIDRERRAQALREGTLMPRHIHRHDVNHAGIIAALRSVGALVIDTSGLGDFVDAVVAYRGRWYILEIKNLDTAYGRRGLSVNQQALATAAGSAPIHVVASVDDALTAIGAV